MRRGPLVVGLVVVVSVGLAALAVRIRVPPGPRSIVLVTIDTLRADRGAASRGAKSLTPHLDALAAAGARFDQAWTVAPLTVPAHATLLTGRLPAQHGLRTNEPRHILGPRESRGFATLAEALRSEGSRTAAFVSASVLRNDRTGLGAGFDTYDDVAPAKPGAPYENERKGDATVDAALAWVGQDDRPFFLWVHLFDPHAPYDAPLPWGRGAGHVTDSEGYDGEVAYADHCLGRLLDGLADRGDLVVAVVADHGESLGEHGEKTHGFLLHEATLHVPLVIHADGSIPPGTVRTDPVSTRDLATTLLALARIAPPEGMYGEPLLGKRRGSDTIGPLYAETFYGYDAFRWAQTFALRIGDWKIVSSGPEVREADLGADPGETATVIHDAGSLPARPSGPRSLADALDVLRHGAEGTASGGVAAPTETSGGAYWSATGAPAALLDREANRRLPSPYARITDVGILDAGQTLLGAGAPDRALVQFDEVVRRDPANPQAQFWRGSALAALRRPTDAAAAYQRALDLGWLEPKVVEKSLQAWMQAAQSGDAGAPDRALAFLEGARGRGVRDSCSTRIFEAAAHIFRRDAAAARTALDRARSLHPNADETKWIDETERAIEGLPR